MPQQSQTLDQALERLADLLGGGAQPGRPAGPGPRPQPPTPTPSAPAPSPLEQQEAMARQYMHLASVPILTPRRIEELERDLPQLVASLRALPHRPSLKRRLRSLMEVVPGQVNNPERMDDGAQSEGDGAFWPPLPISDLANEMRKDLAVGDERILPVVGLAFFMAGYTISKAWGD